MKQGLWLVMFWIHIANTIKLSFDMCCQLGQLKKINNNQFDKKLRWTRIQGKAAQDARLWTSNFFVHGHAASCFITPTLVQGRSFKNNLSNMRVLDDLYCLGFNLDLGIFKGIDIHLRLVYFRTSSKVKLESFSYSCECCFESISIICADITNPT